VRGDVLKALTGLGRAGFDVILADPPYRQRLVQQTVERVAELGLLAEDGVFVGEHHRDEDLTAPAGWQVPKRGRYGDSRVTMMTNRGLPTAAVEQE
jgi:16S rRNA G966 N2-methylase RsmD